MHERLVDNGRVTTPQMKDGPGKAIGKRLLVNGNGVGLKKKSQVKEHELEWTIHPHRRCRAKELQAPHPEKWRWMATQNLSPKLEKLRATRSLAGSSIWSMREHWAGVDTPIMVVRRCGLRWSLRRYTPCAHFLSFPLCYTFSGTHRAVDN